MNKLRASLTLVGLILAISVLAASVMADLPVNPTKPSVHSDQVVVPVFGNQLAYLFVRVVNNALVGTPINFSFVFTPQNGFQAANDVWLSYRLNENTVGGPNGLYVDFTVKVNVNSFSYFKSGATRTGDNYGTMYLDHIADSAALIHPGINSLGFQAINTMLENGGLYGEFHLSEVSLIIQYSYVA